MSITSRMQRVASTRFAGLKRFLLLVVVCASVTACATAHYPINPKLARIDTATGYRPARIFQAAGEDHFFMHLSVSGGGARAAALGLGVLEALRETSIRWAGSDKRLIDELDILMGLSGGSMLAGWVAVHGVDDLAGFERAFLNQPLQANLLSLALSPASLWRIQSPRFGRGDLLAEYLDERLFKGATFGDLSRVPRKPYVLIYATDMATGARFEFAQDQFDYLCSDLDGLPLSRAVAASSAAPLVLAPITLWNYAPASGPGCGEPPLRALQAKVAPVTGAAQRLAELEIYRQTANGQLQRPYIHLLDGGLSDNVGARGPIDYIAQFGSVIEGTRMAGYRAVRRVVFIGVNAETSARSPEDNSADVPGPLRAALALADIPINRNSATALAQKRAVLQGWEAEVAAAHARGDHEVFAPDAKFYLIEVNLADEADPALRARLLAIPTSLELAEDDVRLLRQHAAGALRRSGEFQRLLRELPP